MKDYTIIIDESQRKLIADLLEHAVSIQKHSVIQKLDTDLVMLRDMFADKQGLLESKDGVNSFIN